MSTPDPAPGSALELRASDAEREQVVDELRDHAAAGRLDADELAERVDEAYAARTRGELERVLRELPRPEADVRAEGRERARRRLYASVGSYLTTNAICIAIWGVSGAGYFWPVWVLVPWGIALLGQAWHVLGPYAGQDERHDWRRRHRHGRRPSPPQLPGGR